MILIGIFGRGILGRGIARIYQWPQGWYAFRHVDACLNEQYPDFSASDDSLKIQTLREFVFKNIPFAMDPGSLSNFNELCGNAVDYRLQMSRCFSLSKNGRAGGYCDLMGQCLFKMYVIYGYESTPLNVGFASNNSHVLVLVKNPKDKRWYIEDPTFNQEYCRIDGSPMPADEVLSRLRQGKASEIVIANGNTTVKYGISTSYPGSSSYPTISYERIGDRYMCKIDSNRKYYRMDGDMEKEIEKAGFPADVKYSLLFPFDKDIYFRLGIEGKESREKE